MLNQLASLHNPLHIIAASMLSVYLVLLLKQVKLHRKWLWNVLFCFAVLAFTLRTYLLESYPVTSDIFNALEYFAPVFFIICIRANFQEPLRIGTIEKLAGIALILLLIISKIIYRSSHGLPNSQNLPVIWAQFALSAFCVAAGFWVALQDWNSDLVAKRRLARQFFVFGLAPTILLVIALHALAIIDVANEDGYNSLIALIYTLVTLILFYFTATIDSGWLQDAPKPASNITNTSNNIAPTPEQKTEPEPNSTEDNYSQELAILNQAMTEQEMYNHMGLTLTQLAHKLATPEYRLRAAINQGLGYRNFNTYLNHYRINTATQLLQDANNTDTILDISIAVGYKSLSTFNRAFKEQHQQTPSDFRKQQV